MIFSVSYHRYIKNLGNIFKDPGIGKLIPKNRKYFIENVKFALIYTWDKFDNPKVKSIVEPTTTLKTAFS